MESRIAGMKKLNDNVDRCNMKIRDINLMLGDLVGNSNSKMIIDDNRFNSLKESLLVIQKRVQELSVVAANKYNDLKHMMNRKYGIIENGLNEIKNGIINI
jgi:hypothetical protein